MSQPVTISRRHGSADREPLPPRGPSLSSSPAAVLGTSPLGCSVTGSSPPARSSTSTDKNNPYLAAKKFWKRLCYDGSLDPSGFKVGFLETRQQAERRSGAEAWSLRVQERLAELPFAELAGRLASGEDDEPPFHRIVYFRDGTGAIVWESDYHKRRTDVSGSGASAGGYESGGGAPGGLRVRRNSGGGTPGCSLPPLHPAAAPITALSGSQNIHIVCGFSPSSAAAEGVSDSVSVAAARRSPAPQVPPVHMRGPRGMTPAESSDSDDDDRDDHNAYDDDGLSYGGEDGEVSGLLLMPDEDDGGSGEVCVDPEAPAGRVGGGSEQWPEDHQQQQQEVQEVAQLPEECWMKILCQLPTREVCMMGRVNRWLRQLSSDGAVWREQHEALFGEAAPANMPVAAIRRVCRRSELRAARWLEAKVREQSGLGFPGAGLLLMDDTKAISADGCAVRLWSHDTGRRLSTLQGHTARVSALAFDEEVLLSGCTSAVVKVWGMDDMRVRRTLRGHDGAITDLALLNGIPLSASEDGAIKLWDVTAGTSIVSLDAEHPVYSLRVNPATGALVSAGWDVHLWDVTAAHMLGTLGGTEDDSADDSGTARPYTCVAFSGALVAAGRAGEVTLFDTRDRRSTVARLYCADIRVAAPQQPAAVAAPVQPISHSGGASAPASRRNTSSSSLPSPGASAMAGAAGLPSPGSMYMHGGSGLASLSTSPDAGLLLSSSPGGAPLLGVGMMGLAVKAGVAARSPFASAGNIAGAIAGAAGGAGGSASGGAGAGGAAASSGGSTAGAVAFSAAAAASARCCGVMLDDWKLITGFADGRNMLTLHDMRAVVARGGGGGWRAPLLALHAPARINAFAVHEQKVLAGLEGTDCFLWSMTPPTQSAAGGVISGAAAERGASMTGYTNGGAGGVSPGAAGVAGGGLGAESSFGERGAGGGGREKKTGKDKPSKVRKPQTRYPKRGTK